MARGWGNAPPDLKGTLGTLLRTTLFQLGTLRDVAVREIRSGGRELASKAPQRSGSHRTDVLASLGEIIYELARSGELDLDDFPELAGLVRELSAIDDDMESAGAWTNLGRVDEVENYAGSTIDDGTVSALSARTSPIPSMPQAPPKGVWRPNPDDYDESGQRRAAVGPAGAGAAINEAISEAPTEPTARPSRRSGASHITFVDDQHDEHDEADLEEYMHEDDVPDKP